MNVFHIESWAVVVNYFVHVERHRLHRTRVPMPQPARQDVQTTV